MQPWWVVQDCAHFPLSSDDNLSSGSLCREKVLLGEDGPQPQVSLPLEWISLGYPEPGNLLISESKTLPQASKTLNIN